MSSSKFNHTQLINDQDAESITRVEELAYQLGIEDVMTRDVKTLDSNMPMEEVLELFRSIRISGAPVVENKKIIGILSIEDVIHCLLETDLKAQVKDYMTTNPITIQGTERVIEALKIFVNTRHGRLPVVDKDNHLLGILTKGDVTSGLLKALESDIQEEELRRYRASHLFEDIVSDRSSLILRYKITPRDFIHGGTASSKIRRSLIRLGATPQITRRCGIAVYEAEMNLIIHTTNGGTIHVEIENDKIVITTKDNGPGIKNVEEALKPGFSTATEEIRELGFGAGMGLVNIARCTDEMKLESDPTIGTTLVMKILLRENETVGERYPVQT